MTARSSIDFSQQRPSSGHQVQELGLLSLFAFKAKELNESYVQFFNERIALENQYIQGLNRLYDSAGKIDLDLDTKYAMTSLRHVWKEVREGLDRERQARDSFKHAIEADVIEPLTVFKDTHERTRRRVKEDIRSSSADYNDYRERVMKLKKSYEKRYTELETHQRQSAAIEAQARLLQNTASLHPIQSNTSTNSEEIPNSSRPMSPESGHQSAGKEMINAFKTKDWANGKRHLNSFFKNIGTAGANDGERESKVIEDPSTIQSGPKPSALKTAKAKREVEEADQTYRQAVFHLESLRLQRERLQGAAFVSLSEFIEALSDQMRERLTCYAEHHIAAVKTQDNLSYYVRDTIERIDPEKDLAQFKSTLPDDPASLGIPPRYLYVDHSGESFELVFGVKLSDLAMTCGTGDNPPRVVSQAIWALGQRGVKTEGLYRISPRQAAVTDLVRRIEKDYGNFEITNTDEPHTIAGLLKLYLRQLPEPLFRCSLAERVQHTESRQRQFAESFPLLKSKLRKLSPLAFSTLRMVVEHLALVAHYEPFNKMNASSLAIVFQPVLMGDISVEELQGMSAADALKMQHSASKDKTMEDLILYYKTIFDNEPLTWAPPPKAEKHDLKRSNTLATNTNESSRTRYAVDSPLNRHESPPQAPDMSTMRASTQGISNDFGPRGAAGIREQFQVLGRRASQMRSSPSNRTSSRRRSGSNELEQQLQEINPSPQPKSPDSGSASGKSNHRYHISESVLPYASTSSNQSTSSQRKFSFRRNRNSSNQSSKSNSITPKGAGYDSDQHKPPTEDILDSNSIIEAYEASPQKTNVTLPRE